MGVDGLPDASLGNTRDSGAVYVYRRTGTSWVQEAHIKASNTGHDDNFGAQLAMSGDTLIVGSPGEDSQARGVGGDESDNTVPGSGAVYVFRQTGVSWSQEAYLKASNSDTYDKFGAAVAIEGDTLAIGANNESSSATGVGGDETNNAAPGSGAVYVFQRTGTTWAQQSYVKPSDKSGLHQGGSQLLGSARFGARVALSGGKLAVRANGMSPYRDSVVFLFQREDEVWTQEAYLARPRGDLFGLGLAMWETTLAVGAPGDDSDATGVGGNEANTNALNSGAVLLYDTDLGE